MKTAVVSPVSGADIARAAALITQGALVAFPTETVYGLGANGLDAAACARIYAAKGRPSDNPLILHVADLAMAKQVVQGLTPAAAHLFTAFAPGPLTVILPKRAQIPDVVTGGLTSVGIRCPDSDIARTLIRMSGVPIAAPSANLSGRPSPTTAAMVYDDLAGRSSSMAGHLYGAWNPPSSTAQRRIVLQFCVRGRLRLRWLQRSCPMWMFASILPCSEQIPCRVRPV